MNSRFALSIAISLMCSACGAGTASEPGESPPAHVTLRTFEVRLDGTVTSETATSWIADSAHAQLAAACAEWPATSVRIFNPLAPGDFADVSCSAIRGAGATTAEARAALTSEPIGQAQQEWSILGLGCSLFVLGVSSFLHAGCDTPSAENSKRCHDVTTWGFGALGVVCAFL